MELIFWFVIAGFGVALYFGAYWTGYAIGVKVGTLRTCDRLNLLMDRTAEKMATNG